MPKIEHWNHDIDSIYSRYDKILVSYTANVYAVRMVMMMMMGRGSGGANTVLYHNNKGEQKSKQIQFDGMLCL